MNTGKKTQKYSDEFKVKAVQWSHQPHRSVKGVAEALDIHLSCRGPSADLHANPAATFICIILQNYT
ncbi:transposase [Litchfieldella qijiaojingensis]|uniref:transposase n=1 Tax=Litchfieldella qijiaojingensis TaxID=980347 RepID=UPI003BF5081F